MLAKNKSPAVKEIWKVAALVTMKEIWFMRNGMVYEEEKFNSDALKKRILSFTKDSDVRMSEAIWNFAYDLQIIKAFELKCRRVKTVKVTEIFFSLPDPTYFLLCCDVLQEETQVQLDMVSYVGNGMEFLNLLFQEVWG